MPWSLVSAPPTLNTMTATHAIQPTSSIIENVYKAKRLFKLYYSFSINIMNVIDTWNGMVENDHTKLL